MICFFPNEILLLCTIPSSRCGSSRCKTDKKRRTRNFFCLIPRLLSPPIVRFLRVRGRKNGKQRRTVKLHARTTRFWLPQSMSDLEREGTGRRKCDVRDQSRRFGSQNRRGARPRTQLPRPLEEKSGSEGFCLTIYTGGVFTSPRVFTLGFCTRWCRTGGMANVYFLLLLSNRFLLVWGDAWSGRGSCSRGVCMFFLRLEG